MPAFIAGAVIGLFGGFRVGVWAAPSVLVQRLLSRKDRHTQRGDSQ